MLITTAQELKKVNNFLRECPCVTETAEIVAAKQEGSLYTAFVRDYLEITAKVIFRVKNGRILWKCSCGGIKGRYPCHHLIAAIKYFKRQKRLQKKEAAVTH